MINSLGLTVEQISVLKSLCNANINKEELVVSLFESSMSMEDPMLKSVLNGLIEKIYHLSESRIREITRDIFVYA